MVNDDREDPELRVSLVIVLLLLNAAVCAQDAGLRGDARRGERIVQNGTPGGAAACVSCHGLGGEGNAKLGRNGATT